ncbi:MAG: DEAD/DEAH box helicase family protein [Endomicrobium sp.]|jgi:type III restriction enzyme|nr:DEAD/DEAH box helicase family protein [Endomicrobium sp.]
MPKLKTKIKDTLDDFLFAKIKNDDNYKIWEQSFTIPQYITDNLNPTKNLRDYQERAIKHFIWLFDKDRQAAKHLLFNMATGTGKTLVMACCILFLYEKGYRNFLFLVHQIQIKEQAVKNFTDYKFEKYLFNPKGIKINGQKVDVKIVGKISDADANAINLMFFSTPLLYNRLTIGKENSLTREDFLNNNIVIIADEAHRLNVDTRAKNKTEKEEVENWENAVQSCINLRQDNMLLEFSATVDLANENIHEKYEDKLLYLYDFLQFNREGFSKDVKFLYNQETDIENQKKLLIVNAVALSQFRKLFAQRAMKIEINPILLLKSVRIADSEKDREFFDSVISGLSVKDFDKLKAFSKENKSHEYEILADMFKWIAAQKNGLVAQGDWDGLKSFIASVKQSFARDNTLIYNSQKKEKTELLPLLDDARNTIRAIFSVNALNEGWDVLSLYDIIHFDISENKKVSLQDIQLIGRGARFCPYELPKEYLRDEGGMAESMKRNLQTDKYKRKFDNDPYDTGRVLDTFVYHFVKTGTFLENLQRDLLGEGIINEGVEQKTIRMKEKFIESKTYKIGFVLVNRLEKRLKTSAEEIDKTFKKVVKAASYHLHARALSDKEQNEQIASLSVKEISISENFFSRQIIEKALVRAENGFFRFNNLKNHIVGITTINELIEKYLPLYQIKYFYEAGKEIENLRAEEKLQLLIGTILPEIRKNIDLNMPKIIGSKRFKPISLQHVFSREKSIYLTSFPIIDKTTGKKIFVSTDERFQKQTDNQNALLNYDVKNALWYAYDENYGTSEEKKFVKWAAGQVDNLKNKYKDAEIYIIRNELDYWLYNPADGRKFAPDHLLIINDYKNKSMYYQCLIEPKGGHLIEHDKWKEEALISLENTSIIFDADEDASKEYQKYLEEAQAQGYQEIKNIGFKFFNADTNQNLADFALDFNNKLLQQEK